MANTCKYYKQQRQVSYDGGITWSPLEEYQRGDLYERDSADCGGGLVQYQWVNIPLSQDYICEGTTKYYKMKRQVSYDGGASWSDVVPLETQRGASAETQSTDCATGDYKVTLRINNQTGQIMQSTGEIRLYVSGHIGVNIYLPNASPAAGALYTFNVGMNDFSDKDVHCIMNGETYMDDAYNGSAIESIRVYNKDHVKSEDLNLSVTLDTGSDTTIKKSGASYTLKIQNA